MAEITPRLLTLRIWNQTPGKVLTITIVNNAAWSFEQVGRAPGFMVSSPDGSPLQMSQLILSTQTISLGGGAAPGNATLTIHAVPDPNGDQIEGVLQTNGDTMVAVAYATETGLSGVLGMDFIIPF